MDLDRASDTELIEASRRRANANARTDVYLEELYRRSYPKVAYWCLRICGNREEAADLAQEVFLRVHSRLDSFRMDSSFSTWLYTVMRSVAINRSLAKRRRSTTLGPSEASDPADPAPSAMEVAAQEEMIERLRAAVRLDLEPMEAKVLYLHYVNGLTLVAITRLLSLENKSGAKAFLVSAKRKLKKHLKESVHHGKPVLRST